MRKHLVNTSNKRIGSTGGKESQRLEEAHGSLSTFNIIIQLKQNCINTRLPLLCSNVKAARNVFLMIVC